MIAEQKASGSCAAVGSLSGTKCVSDLGVCVRGVGTWVCLGVPGVGC